MECYPALIRRHSDTCHNTVRLSKGMSTLVSHIYKDKYLRLCIHNLLEVVKLSGTEWSTVDVKGYWEGTMGMSYLMCGGFDFGKMKSPMVWVVLQHKWNVLNTTEVFPKKVKMVNTMLDACFITRFKYEVNFILHGNNDFLVELLLVEQLQGSFRKQAFLH